eukprot:gene21289-biopygen16321
MKEVEKTQEEMKKKQDLNRQHIDRLLKESVKKEKENEALLKKLKKNEEELKRANQAVDDLEQYGRKTMLEISGFPRKDQETATNLVVKLAEKLEINLDVEHIEACHRISPRDDAPIIVEFLSRKMRDEFLSQKKKVRNLTIADLGFVADAGSAGKTYINESLTKKRKGLLRDITMGRDEYNFKFIWSNKGKIFVRKSENSPPILINKFK